MRVLLVAEGAHEHHGALETLIARLVPAGLPITYVEKLPMCDPRITPAHGKGEKLTKRILSATRLAQQIGCDALILVLDEDGYPERRPCVREAQESGNFPVQRAVGIAIRSFDAWMLADETAMTMALSSPTPIACQPAPESLPDPKEHFADLHSESRCELPRREVYARIASELRPEILERRCPDGFAPFAGRIRQLHA